MATASVDRLNQIPARLALLFDYDAQAALKKLDIAQRQVVIDVTIADARGVDRAGACDEVWLAAKMSARGKGRESDARYRNLCRRLGFGMLAVTNTGDVEVLVKPPTTSPRRNPKKRSRLVAEHRRRKGDPALGGSTRAPIMTAYRQQALACASALSRGPRRVLRFTMVRLQDGQ